MSASLSIKSMPCLLALLSSGVTFSNRPVARFYYEIDEAVFGYDLTLHWHFNDQNKRDFNFYCYVTNANQSEFYYTYVETLHLGSYKGVYSSDLTISSSYFSEKNYHLMFGTQSISGSSWSDTVYFDGTFGDAVSALAITDTEIFHTGRYWYYSSVYGRSSVATYYDISRLYKYSDKQTLGIENWYIRHYDQEGNILPIEGVATLYLLNHLDDIKVGSIKGTGWMKPRMRTIPLQLQASSTREGYYEVRTSETYYYDLTTGEMTASKTRDDLYYKETNLLYMPGSIKDQDTPFHFWISLTSVNGYDTFMIDATREVATRSFGSCKDSDYCIVIGEN